MKQEILKKVKEQLAKDYNCSVEDFDNRNNLITNIKLNIFQFKNHRQKVK